MDGCCVQHQQNKTLNTSEERVDNIKEAQEGGRCILVTMDDGDTETQREKPDGPPCHQQRFSQNSDGWTVVKVNIVKCN